VLVQVGADVAQRIVLAQGGTAVQIGAALAQGGVVTL
jgi:hypothetical protein